MKACTKHLRTYLEDKPKLRQWLWFIALWLGGLLTVVIGTYPLKWLIDIAS